MNHLLAREPATVALVIALTVALIAWTMDFRRTKRRDLDRVGLVNWTPIFFLALIAALMLTGLAMREWLVG